MRIHSWWIATLLSFTLAHSVEAQKTTFAGHNEQPESRETESALAFVASGDWRVERDQADKQMSPDNPYFNPNYSPAMQMQAMGMPPQGMMPYGAMPVGYQQPMMMPPGQGLMPPVNMQGDINGPISPVGYNSAVAGICNECNGNGCNACSACGCNGAGCGGCCGLFGGGAYCGFGRGIGQPWDMSTYGGKCAPRFFDIGAEATYMALETNAGSQILSTFGVNGAQGTALTTDDVDYDHEAGVRITGNMTFWAGSYLEVSYVGMNNFSGYASATSGTDNLYSAFSGFGTDPAGGFTETDQSSLHSVEGSNRFDSIEMNLRRTFANPGCWWQGSCWGGLRYFRIGDDARLYTDNGAESLSYLVEGTNDLWGVQIGGDLALILTKRLSFTGFTEIGVYGNKASQESTIDISNGGNTIFSEAANAKRASMVVEAGTFAVFRINPRASARLGYQIIYVDGIALGSDNFNFETGGAADLPTALSNRAVGVHDNGAALYHGATAGFELTW